MSKDSIISPAGSKDVSQGGSSSARIHLFLKDAGRLDEARKSAARLVFALDATMSRQPTWDLACRVQGEMFEASAGIASLAVQLVYFRGFDECRASRWVFDPRGLADLIDIAVVEQGPQTAGDILLTAAIELAQLLRRQDPRRQRTPTNIATDL